MADHNDPNAVNSIFSDIEVGAADVYDMLGFPGPDNSQGDRVVLALTFAAVPATGVLDADLLYRLRLFPHPRAEVLRASVATWTHCGYTSMAYVARISAPKA